MNCMRSTQHDVLELCGPLPIVLHPLDVIDPIIAVMMLINSSSKCVVNIEKIKKGKKKKNRTFLDKSRNAYVRDSLQIFIFFFSNVIKLRFLFGHGDDKIQLKL